MHVSILICCAHTAHCSLCECAYGTHTSFLKGLAEAFMRLAVPNKIDVTLNWKIHSVCDAACITDKLVPMSKMSTRIVLAMGYSSTLKNLALQVAYQLEYSISTNY